MQMSEVRLDGERTLLPVFLWWRQVKASAVGEISGANNVRITFHDFRWTCHWTLLLITGGDMTVLQQLHFLNLRSSIISVVTVAAVAATATPTATPITTTCTSAAAPVTVAAAEMFWDCSFILYSSFEADLFNFEVNILFRSRMPNPKKLLALMP